MSHLASSSPLHSYLPSRSPSCSYLSLLLCSCSSSRSCLFVVVLVVVFAIVFAIEGHDGRGVASTGGRVLHPPPGAERTSVGEVTFLSVIMHPLLDRRGIDGQASMSRRRWATVEHIDGTRRHQHRWAGCRVCWYVRRRSVSVAGVESVGGRADVCVSVESIGA
jgi:hypothetical protein